METRPSSTIKAQDRTMVAEHNSEHLPNKAYVIILGLFVLGISTSPIYLVFTATGGLLCLSARRHYQWILGILFIMGMSITYSSRSVGLSAFDDFANVYYPLYQRVASVGLFQVLTERWNAFSISNIEVGLPILFGIFAIFSTEMSAKIVILLLTFLGGVFYLYWVITYLLPNVPRRKSNIALLLSLGLFSFGLCSQLARQMLSIPFFLAAISDRSSARSLFFLIIGTQFHLITVPLYLFFKCLKILPKITIFVSIFFGCILFMYGKAIAASILGVEVGILDKLLYYTSGNMDASDFSYRYLALPIAWSLFLLVGAKYNTILPTALVFLMAFFYGCFLMFPLLSFRLTLFVSAALLGPLIFFALMRLKNHTHQVYIALLIVTANQLRRFVFYDTDGEMSLWGSHAQFGQPFYYFY